MINNNSTGSGVQFTGANIQGDVNFHHNSDTPKNDLNALLQSLAFEGMYSRQWDIRDADAGTCDWVVLHDTYAEWASCTRSRLLWFKGHPGSGKSTLIRHTQDRIERQQKPKEDLILSHFFHNRGGDLQKNREGFFRSLLHQLGKRPHALEDLLSTFQTRCRTMGNLGQGWCWEANELKRTLKEALEKVLSQCGVWIFIDALDECQARQERSELVQFFQSLVRNPSQGLKVCFAHRPHPFTSLDGVDVIPVHENNYQDIKLFVQENSEAFHGQTGSIVRDLIPERARGIFLWAHLVLQKVAEANEDGQGPREIQRIITDTPQEMNKLYEQLLRQMTSPQSKKLIQWVCYAMAPLSMAQIRMALTVEAGLPLKSTADYSRVADLPEHDQMLIKRIHMLSSGLVEITSHQYLQFIHQTVKEFFVNKGLPLLLQPDQPDPVGIDEAAREAHRSLSRSCLCYVAIDDFHIQFTHGRRRVRGILYTDIPQDSFMAYAAQFSSTHVVAAGEAGVPSTDLIDYLGWPPRNDVLRRWAEISEMNGIVRYSPVRVDSGHTTPAHMMAQWHSVEGLQELHRRAGCAGLSLKVHDSEGDTPMAIACRLGSLATAQWLYAHGALLDFTTSSGASPLHLAIRYLANRVMHWLIEKGAEVDTADNLGSTPLIDAAIQGHKEVVELLINKGAQVDRADNKGVTPLMKAVEWGHKEVVELLVDKGAQVDRADNEGVTPLMKAVEWDHKEVVKLLVNKGAQVDRADNKGVTPLMKAVEWDHKEVVELLVDKGAQVDRADNEGVTPLMKAVEWDHKEVVELLVDKGAQVDKADKSGRIPLTIAMISGYKEVVELLIDKSAQVDKANNEGFTPLTIAVVLGYKEVVELLIDKGAQVDKANNEGFTPLMMAVIFGHKGVVELLIDKGAQVDRMDIYGVTPLIAAKQEGHGEIVSFLRENGALEDA